MVKKQEPKEVNCFQCQNSIIVRYNYPQKDYSNKNNWGWWTEKKENEGKYICDKCLEELYYKNKEKYWKSVKDQTKRQLMRNHFYARRKKNN